MADTKISALPAATSLGDTDELVLATAGSNKKITGANLKTALGGVTPVVVLTQAAYDALAVKDPATVYVVT